MSNRTSTPASKSTALSMGLDHDSLGHSHRPDNPLVLPSPAAAAASPTFNAIAAHLVGLGFACQSDFLDEWPVDVFRQTQTEAMTETGVSDQATCVGWFEPEPVYHVPGVACSVNGVSSIIRNGPLIRCTRVIMDSDARTVAMARTAAMASVALQKAGQAVDINDLGRSIVISLLDPDALDQIGNFFRD